MTAEKDDKNLTEETVDLEDTQTNKTLLTSCKDCIFATKEEKTQTGCSLERLEKFINRGTSVIEAEDEEENEFYVIESWCSGYREDVWKTAHGEEDLLEILDQENCPAVGFVIIIKDSLDGIEATINSALEQEKFKPFQILLINAGDKSYFDVIEKAQELLEDKDVLYKVQAVNSEITKLQIVDEAFINAVNGYYSVFECGKEIPKDLIKTLNKAVNYDIVKAGYIKGFDGINGMTVQCALHKFLVGNKGIDLEQKLRDGEEYDGVESNNSLIKTWDELK